MTELVRWQQRKTKTTRQTSGRPHPHVAASFSAKALEQLAQIRDVRVKDILDGNVPAAQLVVQKGCVVAVKSRKRAGPPLGDAEHAPRDERRPRGARLSSTFA